MRQYFIRHAHAVEGFDWEGDDLSRPLTREGKDRMRQAAERFFHEYPLPDAVISSEAVRAEQTAEIISGVTGAPCSTESLINPGARIADWLDAVKKASDIKTAVFVGHEPDMSGFLSFYTAGNALCMVLKKGSICHIENRYLVNLVQQKLLLD